MSSSGKEQICFNDKNKETTPRHLTTSRSLNTVSSSRYFPTTSKSSSRSEWIPAMPVRNSSDSEVSNLVPSYMDILNGSGQDWLDAYDFAQEQLEQPPRPHRRTYHQQNAADKQSVTVRKTKSLRDNTHRSKLRSPPPPPPSQNTDFIEPPRLPERKQSMQFMNKIKRKLSFNSKDRKSMQDNDRRSLPVLTREPRRTVSSSILDKKHHTAPPPPKLPPLAQQQQQQSANASNGLSEYQGYSRHTKNRSFAYSPPPPPRSSSLNVPDVPAVPPVPPVPKIQTSRSIRRKKSDISTPAASVMEQNGDNQVLQSVELVQSPIADNKLISPQLTPSTSAYAMGLSQDLAQIEEDIKALEIQRERHSSFVQAAEMHRRQQKQADEPPIPKYVLQPTRHDTNNGRKRGKTLPGSLATPPPIPTVLLPPMMLNPIQMTIPNNLQKKPAPLIPLRQSTSTTPLVKDNSKIRPSQDAPTLMQEMHNTLPPGLDLGSGGLGSDIRRLERKSSLSNLMPKRKSHIPITTTKSSSSNTLRRAASYRQPAESRAQQYHHHHPPQQPQQQHHHHHHHHQQQTQHNGTANQLSPPPLNTAVPKPSTAALNMPTVVEGARSPKSISTALKYYGQYLTDYERQIEIHDYSQIYFVGPHAQTKHAPGEYNFGFDDERGDYKIVLQDHLAYRYEVIDILGRGSFGQVVKCFDHKTAQMVAVKLIRNKKRFHAQAVTEVNILKKLVEWDPQDQYHTIHMTDHFYFRNHLCIAFECLSMNLYEFIKSNHFQGFSLNLIKRITYQILQSLTLLSNHNIIHCDLKPENIMLKHPAKSTVKVIDFGSSCFESERVYTYIQSRFYRSPEVILGISYHKAIDMWSVGCIIAELFTGLPLFPGENEQEQLSCIMETMGLPDRHLIEQCSRRKLFFDSAGNPRIVANSKGKKRFPGSRSLYQALKCHDIVFVDFVERCLHWDPAKRMTPQEALQHEWITSHRSNSNNGAVVAAPLLSSSAVTMMQRNNSMRV